MMMKNKMFEFRDQRKSIQRRIVRLKVCCQFRDLRYGDRVRHNSVTNIIGTKHRPTKDRSFGDLQNIHPAWLLSNFL
nr:hypothetical protein CFP56_55788 [Quercus suber]